MKGTVNGVTTVYVGNHYEKQGATVRKYYYAGSQRVAMRENGVLYWLLVDHLGSTAIVANASGAKVGEVRYKAWGEERPACGSPPCGTIPTTYRYTGQRWESGIGLYFYNARWYDPALGRFVQPDTVQPDPRDPQQLNRFAYARNNPLRFTDPTGHDLEQIIFNKTGKLPWSLSWLRGLDRQEAVEQVVNYVENKTGLFPAPGVSVRYGGQGPIGFRGGNYPRTGSNDPYIDIFEEAFSVQSADDLAGVVAEEIIHSQQEAEMESLLGRDIWSRPARVPCLCPDVSLEAETEGIRYIPAAEMEAKRTVLSLQALNLSESFRAEQERWVERYQRLIDRYPDFFYSAVAGRYE